MASVEVFILSHDRPKYLIEALDSILGQDFGDLSIVVSDNSTGDDVESLIAEHPQKSYFSFRRRSRTLSAIDHFNLVFQESSSEFTVVFHDDDIMLPGGITKLHSLITSSSNLVAAGGNAFMMYGDSKTSDLFAQKLKTGIAMFESAKALADQYLRPELGHVPFPSYIYRSAAAKKIVLKFNEGRKHADVSFILKLAQMGSIAWANEPVLFYRKHSLNDSNKIDILAIFSLVRFLRTVSTSPELVTTYQMRNLALAFLQNNNISKDISNWKYSVLKRTFVKYLLSHPFATAYSILKRLFRGALRIRYFN